MLLKDGIRSHRKILKAGGEAAWLWAAAIDYSRNQRTDGFIPMEALPTLGNFREKVTTLAERAVAAGLLEPFDGGFYVDRSLLDEPRPSSSLRSFILERDEYRCTYCGSTWEPFHIDHKLPRSRGGTDDAENLTTACQSCNCRKHTKTAEEFIAFSVSG